MNTEVQCLNCGVLIYWSNDIWIHITGGFYCYLPYAHMDLSSPEAHMIATPAPKSYGFL